VRSLVKGYGERSGAQRSSFAHLSAGAADRYYELPAKERLMDTTSSPKTTAPPTGIELTALDASFREDPYPVLERLRALEPVHRDEVLRRWVLTRHDDVDRVVNDRSLSSDPRKAAPGTYMALFRDAEAEGQPSILFLDPPDHTRLRGLVSKAFTPRAVEQMAPRIQEIVDELLDAVAGAGEFDLMAAFAGPLPTIVIAEMLGVDPADRDEFKRWSDESVLGFNPMISDEERARVAAAGSAMDGYLRRAIAERRENPRADLMSALIAAEEAGDQLTTDEVVTMCALLLAAGNVTTTDLIGNGVLALLRHPDQLAALHEEPDLIGNAVEEMLRFDGPVVQTGRVTLSEQEIEGHCIGPGESILTSLAAANHDPAIYQDPDRFDIMRGDVHHHAFGGGIHYCLGAPLARLEARIAIGTLVRRFPNLHLAGEPLEWRRLPSFRGLLRLPVLV
jgi:cytochrome P450